LKTRTSSNRRAVTAAVVLLVCTVMVGVTAAQPGPPQDAPRWGRERIETVIIGKFSSELNLTPEQAEQFFPRLKQFQNRTEDLQRDHWQRFGRLEELSQDPQADKDEVNQLIAREDEFVGHVAQMRREFLTDVSSFLSPQQISRCSILMDELPRRVRQFVEEHQRMRGIEGPPAMSGPQGPPAERPRHRRSY
jgi:Spy/CpxP family protein refolding chaperone